MSIKINTYSVSKQQLITVPVPTQTRTYKPISHEQLIDLTLNSINGAGFTIDKEMYSSAREGNISNGKFTLKNVADKEMQIQIAFQNSYDKSLSLKYAIGVRVFICENGCVHGDFGAFKKKHQGEVQEFTPKAITEYIKRAGETFKQMQKEREEMKKIGLSERVRAELIGRMFIEEEFITSTQINVIKDQLSHPEFDYNCPNSMWELYQYTTQGMKDIHPTLWMENHIKAHKFFVNELGILVNEHSAPVFTDISPNQTVMEFTPGVV
jgi:hypothetical protein